jgi:osmotically inducible lipoprotein OsmB
MTPAPLSLLRTTTGLAACAALLGLSACAGMSEQTRDTTIGAGVGAVAGSVLTGSTAGAAVGAVIGGVIGHENDENDKKKK